MPYALIDDGELWYDRAGTRGPRVLLVMGLAMRGIAWRFQIDALAGDHELAWYDGRGVGLTRAAVGGMTMSALAADAVALLDHLGWPDAHVVGISMGGMIAQHVALDHRPRVASLALIATHPGGLRWLVPPLAGLLNFLVTQIAPPKQRLAATEHLLYTRDYLRHVDRVELRQELVRGVGPRRPAPDLLAQLGAILGHDTRRRLGELAGLPTLVVAPGRDKLIDPRAAVAIHRAIPGSTLVAVGHAGHGITRERAESVNAALRRHVAASCAPA